MRSFEKNMPTTCDVRFQRKSVFCWLVLYAVGLVNMMLPIVIVSGVNSYVLDKVSADVSKPWCTSSK